MGQAQARKSVIVSRALSNANSFPECFITRWGSGSDYAASNNVFLTPWEFLMEKTDHYSIRSLRRFHRWHEHNHEICCDASSDGWLSYQSPIIIPLLTGQKRISFSKCSSMSSNRSVFCPRNSSERSRMAATSRAALLRSTGCTC